VKRTDNRIAAPDTGASVAFDRRQPERSTASNDTGPTRKEDIP
jgi:hypothetical protein